MSTPPPRAPRSPRWQWALIFVFFLGITVTSGLYFLGLLGPRRDDSVFGAVCVVCFFGFWTVVAFLALLDRSKKQVEAAPAAGEAGPEAILAGLGIPLDFTPSDPQTALTGGLAKANVLQGVRALQAGRGEDAVASFTFAIDRLGADPRFGAVLAVAHYLRGVAHEGCQRPEPALADYSRALELSPGHRQASEASERLQRRPQSPSEADLLDLGFPPHYGLPAPAGQEAFVAWLRATVAFAYRTCKQGRHEFAVRDANKLIEDDRLLQSAEHSLVLAAAFYVRSLAHERLGDVGQAALDYRAALERRADYGLATSALHRVTH